MNKNLKKKNSLMDLTMPDHYCPKTGRKYKENEYDKITKNWENKREKKMKNLRIFSKERKKIYTMNEKGIKWYKGSTIINNFPRKKKIFIDGRKSVATTLLAKEAMTVFNPKNFTKPDTSNILRMDNGDIVIETWHKDDQSEKIVVDRMLNPCPQYRGMQRLLVTVVPREKLLMKEEVEKLTQQKLCDYQIQLNWWHHLWRLNDFFMWHRQCQLTETCGRSPYPTFWRGAPGSAPIKMNILDWCKPKNYYRWIDFAASIRLTTGRLFDIIVTDPPWMLATENATRGVALNYDQVKDSVLLEKIPFDRLLNPSGVIFMWVINSRYHYACQYLERIGFIIAESVTWAKMTRKRLNARGHGYYFQHAKEECLIAYRGNCDHLNWESVISILPSEKRCQSQKPTIFYDMVESLIPNGNYIEIFCRRNNLRDGWVGLGNQL